MNFQAIPAVLESIVDAKSLPRQLPGLPDRDETDAELPGDRRSEHEPPGLDAEDLVGRALPEGLRHRDNSLMEGRGRRQERGDVAEEDPRRGEIRDIADELAEIPHPVISKEL